MNDLKASLRIQLRKEYAALGEDYKQRTDQSILSRLKKSDLYRGCNKIFLYASCGNEINTLDFIQEAFAEGKTILLPKSYGKGIMEFFAFNGTFLEGRYGILEPTGICPIVPNDEDLMIVPGLAFSQNGIRMGQGGGYYDRYLEKYPCTTVGLCRELFLKKDLPIAWNDLPVDYVITENNVYQCKNGAS